MQPRPSEFSTRLQDSQSHANATTTQHGQLHHDGSSDPSPGVLGLGTGVPLPEASDTAADAPLPDAEESRVERNDANGMSGRKSGKRTPSPVDKIIEHERASPKYAPNKDSSPGFLLLIPSKVKTDFPS